MSQYFTKATSFQTDRLFIREYDYFIKQSDKKLSLELILEIMSPEVTQSLPIEWQHIKALDDASIWLQNQLKEADFFIIQHKNNDSIIGFLFLYETSISESKSNLHIGYLLSKDYWGEGLGSELISGLVLWGQSLGTINSFVGGVEVANIGSIKVLEKNGFIRTESENKDNVFYTLMFE